MNRPGHADKLQAGNVAVVTGAASGIGRSLAQAFAARSMSVVVADLHDDAARRVADELGALGVATLAVATDVSDEASVAGLAAATFERFGRVDVLCNNAGVSGSGAPMWQQPMAAWHWLADVMLYGVVHGVRAFVPAMVDAGSGYVLNTASVGGLIALPGQGPYNAVKHAVVGLTEGLAAELRAIGPGLGAGVLCPGQVATALQENTAALRPAGVVERREAGEAEQVRRASYGRPITPDQVAVIALDGIAAGRLHMLTGGELMTQVAARLAAVAADIPAPPSRG